MKIISEQRIKAHKIVISPRPVWKCRTCPMFGKTPSCPPLVPSWQESLEWLKRFNNALLIKFEVEIKNFQQDKREILNYLLEKEAQLFREGFLYCIALFPGNCNLCNQCDFQKKGECSQPSRVRPSMDALGIECSSIIDINFKESVLYGLLLID